MSMKKIIALITIALFPAGTMTAQPKKSRVQTAQQQKKQTTTKGGVTQRMQIAFPTAIDMPEDVVWRRDIYREVELTEGTNAGLYYPVMPQGKQMNLFTYIFKLAQNGYIPIYEYSPTESEERFTDDARRPFKEMLEDQGVYYEEKDGKLTVMNSDIPSEEVKRYFLKESAYYDQANSTFHRKVLALCPVRVMSGEFGEEPPRPMFWVKFSDLAPFLNRQTVMTSDRNNAATMSMEDFFTLNRYSGKIYKTTNMLGRNLADYCPDDSTLAKEQRRIESELEAFRNNIFGDQAKKDSLDSIAAADPKAAKVAKTKTRRTRSSKTVKSGSKSGSSGGGSAAPRVSVRRQRH